MGEIQNIKKKAGFSKAGLRWFLFQTFQEQKILILFILFQNIDGKKKKHLQITYSKNSKTLLIKPDKSSTEK